MAATDDDRSDPAEQSSLKATDSIEGRVEPLPRRVDPSPSEPVQPVYDVPRQLSVIRDDRPVVVSPSAFLSLRHSKWRNLLLNARLRAICSS